METASLSRQISAVPDLCCIVTQGLVESVGGVFDPVGKVRFQGYLILLSVQL